MPHRLKELCASDTVYDHPLISVTFTLNGNRVYIVKEYDDYLDLKKEITKTYRIVALENCCSGVFKCTMESRDGSTIIFHLDEDDIAHNMRFAEKTMSVQEMVAMIC